METSWISEEKVEKDEDAPWELEFEDHIFDLAFHPQRDVIAVALISGEVPVYAYSNTENKLLYSLTHHEDSCRSLEFSKDGQYLFTTSSDKSMAAVDLNTGKVVYTQDNAHIAPVNRLITYGDHMLVTGDDEGCVKFWDLRTKSAVYEWQENEDFIADMAASEERHTLLAAGGDGYLSVFELRKGTLEARSDNIEDELLSIKIVKNGKKVITGTQDGIIYVWSWGNWGDVTDRFPGHPKSIDTMVAFDEDTVATGSSDGLIRIVNILPNKLLGVAGEHQEFPIERISLSRDKNLLASCSHDQTVKFWNVSYLYDKGEDDGEEEMEQSMVNGKEEEDMDITEEPTKPQKSNNKKKKPKKPEKNMPKKQDNFFSGLL